MRFPKRHTLAATLFAAALLPGSLAGQTPWLGLRVPSGFTLEAVRPFFEDGDDFSALTSAWFGSLRLDAGAMRVVAELPFAHADSDDSAEGASNAVGNLYLGIERQWQRTMLELGVRLPTAKEGEFASFVGAYADPDRINSFFPDITSVDLRVGTHLSAEGSPVTVRLHGGPTALFYTGDASDVDPELMLGYGVQAWYGGQSVEAGGGITGVALLTEDGSFGERTYHHAGLTLNLLLARVRPGINFRVPLDDDLDAIDFTIGLHLTVPIGGR